MLTLPSGDGPKTVYVQYRDLVGHISSSVHDGIVLDTLTPTSSAFSPTSTIELSFEVNWSGTDTVSGLASYDVQYRVGSGSTWAAWLSETVAPSAIFGPASPVTLERGETYYFRVRARDNAGNLEAYPGGDGDTSTFVENMFTIYLPVTLKGF